MIGYTLQELEDKLVAMEDSLPYKGKALLEFCTDTLPTAEDLLIFDAELIVAGFKASKATAEIMGDVAVTTLVLQKGSPIWAALIGVLPLAIVGGLITFGITRLPQITSALLPIILAGGGVAVMIAGLLARPAERVAAAYVTARR